MGYDLGVAISLMSTRCFTGGISALRDKEDINANFIYLVASERFGKGENSIF